MLKEKVIKNAFLLYFFDISIVFASFFIAYWIRDSLITKIHPKIYYFAHLYPLSQYIWILLLIIPLWSLLFIIFKLYHSKRVKSLTSEIFSIFKALLLGNIIIWAILFSFKYYFISRPFIFIFGIINFLFMAIERSSFRLTLRQIRKKGYNQKLILIVGTNKCAIKLAKLIQKNKDWGFRLIGLVSYSEQIEGDNKEDYPILGTVKDLPQLIEKTVIDEIIFTIKDNMNFESLADLFLMCEEVGIRSRVVLDFFPFISSKIFLDKFQDVPLLTFSNTPSNIFTLSIKRLLDIIISLFCLVILSPLFLLIAILIKITSRGPILFKIKNDPRITNIGKILRKYSLDEFAQLWNVVKGDMSLVGPRPPIPEEVLQYKKWQRRRLSMKPGITCLWQVSGRSKIDFDTWMKLDLQYIDNWSLGLDLKILLKTIPAVIFSRGAM